MLPTEFRQQKLHRAHVKAVAAIAGMDFDAPETDCGVDGTFRTFAKIGDRVLSTGVGIDCQLKSSIDWRLIDEGQTIAYDLDVKNYNDLVYRKRALEEQNACYPLILVILALPRDESRWLQIVEDRTILEHCCYWYAVERTDFSQNQRKQVVHIPRTQLLTPSALSQLVEQVQNGAFP